MLTIHPKTIAIIKCALVWHNHFCSSLLYSIICLLLPWHAIASYTDDDIPFFFCLGEADDSMLASLKLAISASDLIFKWSSISFSHSIESFELYFNLHIGVELFSNACEVAFFVRKFTLWSGT